MTPNAPASPRGWKTLLEHLAERLIKKQFKTGSKRCLGECGQRISANKNFCLRCKLDRELAAEG